MEPLQKAQSTQPIPDELCVWPHCTDTPCYTLVAWFEVFPGVVFDTKRTCGGP